MGQINFHRRANTGRRDAKDPHYIYLFEMSDNVEFANQCLKCFKIPRGVHPNWSSFEIEIENLVASLHHRKQRPQSSDFFWKDWVLFWQWLLRRPK